MHAEELSARYRVMQRYVGWKAEDARGVADLRGFVLPHAPGLIEDFYAEIGRHAEASQVITGGAEQVARLSRTLHQWLEELLTGPYDEAYMARRWKVGHRHVEIGLAQRYATLALARLRAGIVECVRRGWNGSDGDLVAALASLHKLLDLENALIHDAYDTEFVNREKLLERQRSERKFRRLVESANCLIVILTEDLSVEYFNPCAERTTGYRKADLQHDAGRVLSLLGCDVEQTKERMRRILSAGDALTCEEHVPVHSGELRWINWTFSRLEEFDEKFAGSSAILAVGHDVTEARVAAERLIQASRLATIGEMYSGLAHESRNALQRLRACTDLLADQVSDRPSARTLVERSYRAQEDLQQLLDEVRSYSAPMVLDRSECRASSLWRESWSLLQVQRRSRRADLSESSGDGAALVLVDRFHMVQAFRNILENALAACKDPVVISIACREIKSVDHPLVEVTIEDNGPGFNAAAIHRVFEPFYTTKSTGTGLGLAIVKRVVDAHGGEATASVATGGGARIRLTLPGSDRGS
jgi:PAS domain S-box-containing protein